MYTEGTDAAASWLVGCASQHVTNSSVVCPFSEWPVMNFCWSMRAPVTYSVSLFKWFDVCDAEELVCCREILYEH